MKRIKLSVLITSGVIALGVVIASAVLVLQQYTLNTYRTYLPYITLGDNIKNNASKAHLRLEELIAGDKSVDYEKDVSSLLQESKDKLENIYNGREADFQFLNDQITNQNLLKGAVGLKEMMGLSKQRVTSAENNLGVSIQAGSELDERFDAQYDNLQTTLDDLVFHIETLHDNKVSEMERYVWISVAGILFIFILLGYGIYSIQSKSEAIKKQDEEKLEKEEYKVLRMTQFVDSVANGDFSKNLDLEDVEHDELATTLIKMKTILEESSEESERRNWINTGLANFGDILRSDNDLKSLSDRILSTLVKYLNANQGALYILGGDETDPYMELTSAYAYNRKKFVKETVLKGEGLVGQCWQEGEKIYLKEIPASYIKITSGLGDAAPNCILLEPLKLNDEIYGVIELATFGDFKDFEIEFVEKLAESIAASVSTVKINETTRILLEETQQQAEEMKSQEEEMRQNMEELQATQEEMQRVSSEMSEQLRVINNTIATIEFDLTGHVTEANDNFLELMCYEKFEIMGRHHRMFVDAEEVETDQYASFWRKLAEGQSFEGEFKRINKKGNAVWIKGMYSPMLDHMGNPIKVVKMAYDITQEKVQAEELRKGLAELRQKESEVVDKSKEMADQLKIINGTIATIEFDSRGNILAANDNFTRLMGYKESEIVGSHHRIFVGEKHKNSDVYKEFWRKLGNGNLFNGEFKRYNKKGEEVWIKGMYSPVLDEAGKVLKVVKFAYDITNEKKQAQVLRKSIQEVKENEKLISEQIKVINNTMATVEFDLRGYVKSANSNFLELMGYKEEDVIGQHHSIFVKEQEADSEEYANFWRNLAKGRSFDGEFNRVKKDKSLVWIRGMYSPVLNVDGKVIKVVKFAYDITNEKLQANRIVEKNNELEFSNGQMKALSKAMEEQLKLIDMTIATVEFDLNGNVIKANDNFLNMMGYKESDLIGKHHRVFVTNEEAISEEYRQFWRKLKDGKSFNGEFKRVNQKGDAVWIKGMYSAVKDENDKPIKVVKFAYDITTEKMQQDAINEQLNVIEKMRLKN